jgi:hypothetical protein
LEIDIRFGMLCAMPRPRMVPRRLATLAVAAGAALTLAVPAAASAAPVGGDHPLPTHPIETVTVHGASGHTYVLDVWARSRSKHCAANAHGEVRNYLRAHHCTGVTRYLVTTKVNGRAVAFAQASSTFTGKNANRAYRNAGGFVKLIGRNGTGNYYALFKSGYHVPHGPQHIPSPDAFLAQSQDVGVTTVDAWWVHGKTRVNPKPLQRMMRDIYLQWS